MSIIRKGMIIAAAAAGLVMGSSEVGFTEGGTRQCYYLQGVEPPTSCNTCSGSCLGSGYVCCDIVVG